MESNHLCITDEISMAKIYSQKVANVIQSAVVSHCLKAVYHLCVKHEAYHSFKTAKFTYTIPLTANCHELIT